jgi:predicted Zn-dependent protease
MNRHRRRAAAKVGIRGNPDNMAIPPDVPALFGVAVMHHQAGQLAKAEKCYRQVLKAQPNQADAVHLLGVIALHCAR